MKPWNPGFRYSSTSTAPSAIRHEGIVRCIRYALERLRRAAPPEQQFIRYIDPPLYDIFTELFDSNDEELVNHTVDLYRERFASEGMFENSVYPGITELLAVLRAEHYLLYVVTTKATVFAEKILNHFALKANFLNIYGSELDGTRSAKTDLIAHVLDREQIAPSEAVMVGDREHDIKGALANGVRPIGVLWGYGSGEELTQAGATVLCDTPASLTNHFC